MDIVVTGRHATVSDRLQEYLADKLDKVSQLDPHTQRVEVVVTHEPNPRRAKDSERVEITCRSRGPVIRAEATHDDRQAAVDTAVEKLIERLRRVHDKRTIRRRGGRNAEKLTAHMPPPDVAPTEEPAEQGRFGDSPIEVREKVHASPPMDLEQALQEMELVGHDFYLFHDAETGMPSVVYRRRGWSYGVIHLDANASATGAGEPGVSATSVPEDVAS